MNQPATGLGARRAALRLLDDVLRMGQPLDQRVTHATAGLAPPDRALTIAIVGEVLRWLPDLDALLDAQMNAPLPADAKARTVLRIALAQMLRLGTPAHAAIATALPLVDKGPRRLVHGVLGALSRKKACLPNVPTLPHETAQRWTVHWGESIVSAAARAIASPPPLDLTLRDMQETAKWAEALNGNSLMPGHIRLPRGGPIESLAGYAGGGWWVQDIAASLAARLLGPGNGRTALDLCAAPGGKTMQLAAAGWNVTALDISKRRMELLSANLARTGLAAELVVCDIQKWQPDKHYDAVLLDAPCTATGTFRRHPDVLHRIGARQIAELADVQARLLSCAAGWVKPGGTLVYATCSLEPEEGEAQIEAFLASHPDFSVTPADNEWLTRDMITGQGYVRTRPDMLSGEGGLDGFFVSKLHRVG